MKEKIYTIPVMDAFNAQCECPLCVLHKKLEDNAVEYTLGPSMMEPDSRIESNQKGFCSHHFKLLYEKNNRLSLALILDTHIAENNRKLTRQSDKIFQSIQPNAKKDLIKQFANKISGQPSDVSKLAGQLIDTIAELESACVICEKISNTMEKYINVIIYLWEHEQEFQQLFKASKGFCLPHFKLLLQGAQRDLKPANQTLFLNDVISLELEHLERIHEEVNWFTKKFDYRYQDEPWKNSKDAVPRAIEKTAGFSRL